LILRKLPRRKTAPRKTTPPPPSKKVVEKFEKLFLILKHTFLQTELKFFLGSIFKKLLQSEIF